MRQIWHGNDIDNQNVMFNIFNDSNANHRNMTFTGTKGCGKSAMLKSLVSRYAAHGTKIMIIDAHITEISEYAKLAKALGLQIVSIGPETLDNPLKLHIPDQLPNDPQLRDAVIRNCYQDAKQCLFQALDMIDNAMPVDWKGARRYHVKTIETVSGFIFDMLYEIRGICVKDECVDITKWQPDRTPDIRDFCQLIQELILVSKQMPDKESLETWAEQHRNTENNTILEATNSIEQAIFAYYRFVCERKQELFTADELDVMDTIVQMILLASCSDDLAPISIEDIKLFTGNLPSLDPSTSGALYLLPYGTSDEKLAILLVEAIRAAEKHISDTDSECILILDECWKIRYENVKVKDALFPLIDNVQNLSIWLTAPSEFDWQDNQDEFDASVGARVFMALPRQEQLMLAQRYGITASQFSHVDLFAAMPGQALLQVNGQEPIALFFEMDEDEMGIADTSFYPF